MQKQDSINVLGGVLAPCSRDPLTGFFRDGACNTCPEDQGSHTVCAVMTEEFLEHQRSIGNDLVTPMPRFRFPGLRPGDRWCVCVESWKEAFDAGVAAPVVLSATHVSVLEFATLEELQRVALDAGPRD